ncbi:restriction endonuclease subunit S [Paenibacillus sp. MZ03-122A]|uniref:restriction endonuclease subunit S n=1 Tax=Paenibacillus sp. MZ03-122A TaxID=2962033 RepID=UPI0020B80D0D|nr:restriction endonuclease subunit S [Paenibacillus sp. MZ03-122A]MCP3780435.1 restriction endonuclease subunit S [Paenibacillus sp. MZ03-122A]
MSDKITKSPQIRFTGFTDAWEQVKLKDCFTERSERSAEGELISVTINSGVVRASDLDRKDNSSSDKSNYKVVKVGDIAYNSMRMWQGASGFSPYDGILSPAYTVITPKENSNPKFFAYNFKRHEMISTFQINSQGLTSDTWNLKFPALSSIKVAIPGYWEQTEIACFFEKLDHQLELHRRELQLLKDTKKSLLQKMFPKDGTNVPEIRFAGFTDAWEQRRLGELYTERKERGYDSLQILSVSIHHGVSNEELDSDTLGKKVRRSEDKSLYKHVYFGDLVLNMMRAWQGAIGVVKSEGMVSPAYITAIPNAQLYPLFMDYCLRRDEMILQMNNLSYGVTDFRKRLYWDSFINVLCSIPSLAEQERITDFFTHLDNLITLHQRELYSLENLKKSLLQQMFV